MYWRWSPRSRGARIRLVPDHSTVISFRFFTLRLALRNSLSDQRRLLLWQDVVDEHMAKISKEKTCKIVTSSKQVDWDSGFSDG